MRYRDSFRGVIESTDDEQLVFLADIAKMAECMAPHGKRTKQLTRDTSKVLSRNCKALIYLASYLLSNGARYVILGWFTTDPIEKCFGKLRQGSGGTYFINVKSVVDKINIQYAKLSLKLNLEIEGTDSHNCSYCSRSLNENEVEIVENLFDLECHLSKDTCMAMVYIAGYVKKSESLEFEDTTQGRMQDILQVSPNYFKFWLIFF